MDEGHTTRPHIRASTHLLLVAFCTASSLLGGCATAPSRRPLPVTDPPPPALAVSEGPVVLRATAWLELHAWLAAAAADDRALPDALVPAREAYRTGSADVDRVTAALARCEDERCARAAVAGAPFAEAYAAALPAFHDRLWRGRAEAAWPTIEATHAAFGPEALALFDRLADELETRWPRAGVELGVVAEAPPLEDGALLVPVLATTSATFARRRDEGARARDARIVEAVLVRAALAAPALSATEAELVRSLGPEDGARAWQVLVVHAATTMMQAFARHASPDLATASAAEPAILAWLAHAWRGRSAPEHGSPPPPLAPFVARYITAWKETHGTHR